MKKFKFHLQTVLDQRKKSEETALAGLAMCQRRVIEAKEKKQALEDAVLKSLKRREALGLRPTEIEEFLIEDDFISGTKVRIQHAQLAIQRAEKQVEKAMKAYLLTKRRTRQIEILEEKAKSQFFTDLKKKENKEQDEMSILRARFRRVEDFIG